MGLYAVDHLPEEKKGEIHLQNISIEDFHTSYFDNNNKEVKVTIPGLKTKEFSHSIGMIIRNHLANFILNQKSFHYKTDVNLELAEIKKQITIYE